MVSNELVSLIQTTANTIKANYTETIGGQAVKIFKDYTIVIHNEIDYEFMEAQDKLIEANLLFGSATKNNDIEDKYSQNFVINIQSEINGGSIAKKLFNLIFESLTRTYQILGSYKCKLFLTSPIITNPFSSIESDYRCLMTMNGTLEISKKIVLGATYSLALASGTDITIKPRTPYALKEAVGGMDKNYADPTNMQFTKSSNQETINIVLVYELDGTTPITAHDTLFTTLFNECYGASNQKYTFKSVVGGTTKTISNLICVRGQHIYDEGTGENVLSLQFKVGD